MDIQGTKESFLCIVYVALDGVLARKDMRKDMRVNRTVVAMLSENGNVEPR